MVPAAHAEVCKPSFKTASTHSLRRQRCSASVYKQLLGRPSNWAGCDQVSMAKVFGATPPLALVLNKPFQQPFLHALNTRRAFRREGGGCEWTLWPKET